MMQSGLEEGVAAVERERARVTKIISDKVIIMITFMMAMIMIMKCKHPAATDNWEDLI